MIPTIAVVGTSKSGKTTLIEYLISHFSKEGLKEEPMFSVPLKGILA